MEKALQLTEMLMANVKDYFLRNVTSRDKFNSAIRQRWIFDWTGIRIPDSDDVNAPLICIDYNSCIAPDVNALVHSHTDSIGPRQRQSIFVCYVKPHCDFRREILLENPYEDSTPFFHVKIYTGISQQWKTYHTT